MTGIWPIIDDTTFQLVTGPKEDLWLVKTMGLLLVLVGIVLLTTINNVVSLSTKSLIIAVALSLAIADFWYVSVGVLGLPYLLDGFVQLFFVIAWLVIPHKDKEDRPA